MEQAVIPYSKVAVGALITRIAKGLGDGNAEPNRVSTKVIFNAEVWMTVAEPFECGANWGGRDSQVGIGQGYRIA